MIAGNPAKSKIWIFYVGGGIFIIICNSVCKNSGGEKMQWQIEILSLLCVEMKC